MRSLVEKLLIKAKSTLCILNQPQDAKVNSWGMVDVKLVNEKADVVIAFCNSKTQLDKYSKEAVEIVNNGGIVWMCYPKISSGVKTDINRDTGWEVMKKLDWHAVTQVAINDVWSGLRFRPRGEIGVMTRKF